MTDLSAERITHIAGPLSDEQIAAIETSGATEADLMRAVLLVQGTDLSDSEHHDGGPLLTRLCEVLTADATTPEEERR